MWQGVVLYLLASSAEAAEEAPPPPLTHAIDGASSSAHFSIGVLWLLRRHGSFSGLEGEIRIDASGAAAIEVRVPVASVTMKDPDHVAMLRSPAYFDAAAHPWIHFRAEGFHLHDGAGPHALRGHLRMRGVEREVEFQLQTIDCALKADSRPCHLRVEGEVRRSQFGMVANRRTLADQVHLDLDVLLHPSAPAAP